MAFWNIASKYVSMITLFLILENLLMIGLFVNSVIHYFKIRKLDKSFENEVLIECCYVSKGYYNNDFVCVLLILAGC